jgi:hypothetical protein
MDMTEPINNITVANEDELNRDPLSGAPGSHPLGTGAGAASGGLTGAAVGMAIGGPVGSVIGAAVGAVAGGLSGKSAAEVLNRPQRKLLARGSHERALYLQGNDTNSMRRDFAPAGKAASATRDSRSMMPKPNWQKTTTAAASTAARPGRS